MYLIIVKNDFALNTTKHFLGAVANGDLTTEIDPYVLQRHDEIGDMGRFTVMMKESLSDLVGKRPLTGLHNRHSCDGFSEFNSACKTKEHFFCSGNGRC